jgi:aerobic carbon-monoxide dehydrogenase medium subunit
MKPAAFRYFAPQTVEDAIDLLAEHGEEGKVLAGGQSLVPAMNFRLARPASLIDINRIAALDYLRQQEGALCIGALARHARFETPVAPGVLASLLPKVAHHIAHWPIRTRGTFAGSIRMPIRPPNGVFSPRWSTPNSRSRAAAARVGCGRMATSLRP